MARKTERKRCDVCGMEIPKRPAGKRGAPQRLCLPSTGRECRRLSKRTGEVEGLLAEIIEKVPSASRGRAIFRMRNALKQILIEVRDPDIDR